MTRRDLLSTVAAGATAGALAIGAASPARAAQPQRDKRARADLKPRQIAALRVELAYAAGRAGRPRNALAAAERGLARRFGARSLARIDPAKFEAALDAVRAATI